MALDNINGAHVGEHIGDRTIYSGSGADISSTHSRQMTDEMGEKYSGLSEKIKTFGKEFDEKNATAKDPINFTSKDEMLRVVKHFFSLIDPALGERMNAVMNNYMIQKEIVLVKEGPCQSSITKNGDYLKMEVRITPDGKGLIALAQEIANAYIYSRYVDQQRKEDSERIEAVKKTSAKFFSLLLVEHLSDKLPYMTPEQKESLQYSALNNMSPNIFAKEEDEEFFKKIENIDKFVGCNTPEEYINAFKEIADNPTSNIFGEDVTAKVEEITEKSSSNYLGTKEIVEDISEVVLDCIALEGTEEFFEEAKKGESKHIVLNIVNGAYVTEKLLDKGYTQDQLNNETVQNKIEKINQTEHMPLEKIQELAMEREDNAPVMEMQKYKNNN